MADPLLIVRLAVTVGEVGEMKDADRMAAWDQARGICVACGRALGQHGVVHHRQAKGMGGKRPPEHDRPPNTIVVHDHCHKIIHGNPAAAREAGLIVPSWTDPGTTPMTRLHLGTT